jgi:hypothetical protein
VKDSGDTWPRDCRWMRSSPMAGRRREPGLHVPRLEQVPLLGEVAPDTGEAVGLELELHGEGAAPRLACAAALLRHLLGDPIWF